MQVSNSVSGGASYGAISGDVTVNLETFNEEVTSEATFSSVETGYSVGVKIDKTNGQYHVVSDSGTPEPVTIRLRPIIDAFHPKLWVNLPESGETYYSQKIYLKRWYLIWTLWFYYAHHAGATKGEGKWVDIPIDHSYNQDMCLCILQPQGAIEGYSPRKMFRHISYE